MPLRHRAARDAPYLQRRDDAVRAMADAARPLIAKAIAGALSQFRRKIDPKAIAAALTTGTLHGDHEAVSVAGLADAMKSAFAQIEAAYRHAASHGAAQIDAALTHKAVRKADYDFDALTPDVVAELRTYQDALIQQLEEDARDVIQIETRRGFVEGLPPDQVAAQIRNVVGLTRNQAGYINSYRRALETLDASALARTLTDTSVDRVVRAARASGSGLSPDQIDSYVQDYSDNWVAYRSQGIADTESVRASNLGLHRAYQQAVDRGVFPDEAVKRFWRVASDERVCPICTSIAKNNSEGVSVGEPFKSDDGDIDTSPAHTRCRCSIEYVTDLSMVDSSVVADDAQMNDSDQAAA